MSILTRKGKRWPEVQSSHRVKQMSQRHSLNPGYQAPHTDLFAVTGINRKNSNPAGYRVYSREEVLNRRRSRSHSLPDNVLMRDQSAHETIYTNPITNDLEEQVYDKDFSPGEEVDQQCSGRNCSDRYPFPLSAIMIEAHYNQTVRDFLQICTPIEQVEISDVSEIHDLLSNVYQQIVDQEQYKTPFSVILIFNLESYGTWNRERVIDVLQASINILQNDFDDTTIYSKFHQDGSDGNATNLLLAYEIKYWLSSICHQRLVSTCADFASIILESVLQINDLDNEMQDTSEKANA